MLDKIFAIVSMTALIAFAGWISVRVMEPDLWLVTVVVLAIAVMYFYEEVAAGGSHFEDQ